MEPTEYRAYVGARTTAERNARGDGLNVYRVDAATGRWSHLQRLADLVNPSFLAFDRTRRFLYAVHGDLTEISAFAIAADGTLRFVNRQSTEGRNPVHLAVDPANRFVVVANHLTSSIALLPRADDGALAPVVDLARLEGTIGPHRVEQPFAKPHQVEFDPSGQFIAAPDKGLDCIFTFRIDAARRTLQRAVPPVRTREGAGPRHVAFHPDGRRAYAINELDSTVTAYRFDPATGALLPEQIVSSLPDSFAGNSRAAEIALTANGRLLLASNRGHDSIAVMVVDPDTGRLSPREWHASEGRTPRFFAIDPLQRFVFVANEDSDSIVTFRLDADAARIVSTGQSLRVGSPVCILLAPA